MKQFLQKSYRNHISLVVLVMLIAHMAVATPTPTCPIVTERFQGLADGTTVNNSATGWYLNASNVAGTAYFAVKSNRFHAQELGGEGIWYSKVFSVSGYTDFQVAVKITAEGDMNSSEYARIYYKINGGAEILYDSRTGNFGTIDFISPNLNGSNVQLIVKLYNYNNGGSQTSKYYIEEYRVFKEHGPCASSISVSASAGNGGILTCTNPSLQLSAGTTATGTTTWNWTGPNSFISVSQNPSVNTAGTYTVVATNAAGTGSATVTVTENKAAPVVTATGGTLACGASVTISATSSVAGSLFSWNGPGGFTSSSQNPLVSTAGAYTVTVTNPSNGCSATQSVTVSSGTAAAATIWLQQLTCPNGTTSGNVPYAWSSTTPSGNFSVQNNEFYINNIGTGSAEGVWSSESFSINGKTNVTISVSARSAVTSGDVLESSGSSLDYLRMYYKLNGGSEVLFKEYLGAINSNSAAFSIGSAGSLSGSTLQVIIRGRTTAYDEHYYFDNVTVTGVTNAAAITPSATGNVTCTATAQLSATVTNGTVTAYAWTGPGGFTSAIQNPVVSAGGQYIITATLSGGCTVSAPVTVAENKTTPDISASGATLACRANVTLNVNSSVSGAAYSWTGPNSFTSSFKNPAVTSIGSYTATVTNPANGCMASQTVSVISGLAVPTSFWLEDFTFANGTITDNGSTAWSATTSGAGTYSVNGNEFKTSFSSNAEGVWTSQVINVSAKTGINLSAYLRSDVATDYSWETTDYIRIYYKLNGGAETLLHEDLAGIGSSTSGVSSATPGWSLPNGNTIQLIIKTRNSDVSERYFFDNINLTGSDKLTENITAASSGLLTCAVTAVNLSAVSTTSGLSYSWTGPNSFISTQQQPTVSVAGTYTLTVTNPATACTGTDTALVSTNTTAPEISASVSGSINCSVNSVIISASSSIPGITFSWNGPNSFTSVLQSTGVNTTGTYTVTATNPVNGCTAAASVPVTFSNTTTGTLWLEDFALPNATTVDNGETNWFVSVNPSTTVFAVNNNEFRVSNSSTTGEGIWTSGIIDIAGKTDVSISAGVRTSVTNGAVMNTTGDFADYLRFYFKLNGGAEVLFAEKSGAINNHSPVPTALSIGSLNGASLQIVVHARATGSDEFYYFDNLRIAGTGLSPVNAIAVADSIITCSHPVVSLSGNSAEPDATYQWTGPNGFISTEKNPAVNAGGTYILTVSSGGCTAADTVIVAQNINPPLNVAITSSTNSNEINCLVAGMILTASSSTAGTVFSWNTPNGYAGISGATGAITPGNYIVTATNSANGCIAKDTFTLVTNYAFAMDGIITPGSGILTCTDTVVTLTGSNSLAGVTFAWIGPNGFTATGPVVSVSQPGYYNLIMKHPVSGCNHTIGAQVVAVTNPPLDVTISTASVNSQINCTYNSVTLTGNSSTPGTTYSWAGPNGYTSNASNAVVAVPGEYVLTATNPASGCKVAASSMVVANDAIPANVSATAVTNGGQLTCTYTSINLSGSSSTTGANYSWSGPSGFTASGATIAISTQGSYTLTVTDPVNGCSASSIAMVTQNTAQPAGVSATHTDILTCLTTSIDLAGNSSTPGAAFLWTGPNGFTASTPNTQVIAPGTYQLKVTNPVNGCFRSVFTTVAQDITPPANVSASNSGPLTCAVTSVSLTGSTSASDVDYIWTGPGGFVSFSPVTTVSEPGIYTLIVTDLATNGCSATATTTVTEDLTGCETLLKTGAGQVTALPATNTEQPLDSFDYKIYPNPSRDHVFIEFMSPVNASATVEIYSSNGVREKMIFNRNILSGNNYKLTLDAADLGAGVHFCLIRVNGKVYSQKLILLR